MAWSAVKAHAGTPSPRRSHGAAASWDGGLVVVGGVDGQGAEWELLT